LSKGKFFSKKLKKYAGGAFSYRKYYYRKYFSLGQVPYGFFIYPTLGPLAQSAVSAKILSFTVSL
jgi:hypothetical protein